MRASDLLLGIVAETKTKSYTGSLFYSDKVVHSDDIGDLNPS
ncbi:MAG: hypothetical protein PVI40_08660 [Chlamydiota bacterium]